MRPSGTMRGVRAASAPSIVPSVAITPARCSSAIASTIPEPHTPVTRRPEGRVVGPGSQPTATRGSSVSGSMRTRSIAPGAARCPQLICAPSNAGPVGLEAASSRSRFPSTISAFVPTSTIRFTSSSRCGPSERITPAVSAPTWPAMHGSTYTRAPGWTGSPSSGAGGGTEASNGERERGATELGRVEAEQQVVHDRVADDRELEHVVRSTPASRQARPSAWPGSRARRGSAPSPRRRSSSRTRRGSSGPRRTGSAGSSRPADASTSPEWRSQRWPATVVDPTSNAIPNAASWKPGQIAVTTVPSCTATVTRHAPLRRACCIDRKTPGSTESSCKPHSRSSASRSRARSLGGEASCGSSTSTKWRRTTGSTSIGCASASLRTTWRYTWLSGGTSINDVAGDERRAAEATALGETAVGGVRQLGRGRRGECRGRAGDPVLRVLALGHVDLAAPADPATAADGVEVDAEPARRVEDRRTRARTGRAARTA